MLFVTPHFDDGGGERFFVTLLTHLDRRLFSPFLCAWKMTQSHFVELIPSDVPVFDFRVKGRMRHEVWRLCVEMGRVITLCRPDVILSLVNEWTAVLLITRVLTGIAVPIVACEHGSIFGPARLPGKHKRTTWLVPLLYRYLFARACSLFVPCSDSLASEYVSALGIAPNKVWPINNMFDIAKIQRSADGPPPHPWFTGPEPVLLTVGRLIAHKDLATLLIALKVAVGSRPIRLLIVGDGPERESLQALRSELELNDRVDFVGRQANPYIFMRYAAAAVLSSVSEGAPSVIVEALALGVPVVSTDCQYGPREILSDGYFGLLVPPSQPEALARAILEIIANSHLSQELRHRGPDRASQYSVQFGLRQYTDMLLFATGRDSLGQHYVAD